MKRLFIMAALVLAAQFTWADSKVVTSDEMRQAREKFQDRKFGIFIHWGVYSMLANGEWVQFRQHINRDEYKELPSAWCPSWFSAREWVKTFRNAGAQYITFTSRHHDGFSMWETGASDYNIVEATPYHHDVLKDLAAACAEEGLKLNLYYSHMDWYRPDYPVGNVSKDLQPMERQENYDTYLAFMNQQLEELLTKYGPIGAIWFDGMWDHPASTGFDWHLKEQYDLIHRLQPTCMVGNNHHDATVEGEDFQLFEQDLPGQNTAGFNSGQKIEQLPLETCMTMNNSWGYNITDKNYKSADELIRKLVTAAGMNANFLLNVGPRPDGQLPTEAVERLEAIGRFMEKHGKTIYSTRGGCVPPQEWGVTTQRGKTLFIHILNKDEEEGKTSNPGLERKNGLMSFHVPSKKIKNVHKLGSQTPLKIESEGDGVRIYIPERPQVVDYVLEATVD